LDLIGLVGLTLTGEHQPRAENFWRVLEWISGEAGLSRPQRDPEAQRRYEAQVSISDTYQQIFEDSQRQADTAIEYLESRGISREIATGNVGYLPADYAPPDVEAAKRAGCISQYGNFLFSGRVIIPIRRAGRIVNLYGRLLRPEKSRPNHVYCATTAPPQPPTIWNLDNCRNVEEISFCESIIDGMTLISAGFEATTAIFGTQGLTDARLELLKQSKIRRVNIVFDSDANQSGQKGALRVSERLFRAGIETRIVTLPLDPGAEKRDVNSYFQTHSIDDFRQLQPRDYLDCALDGIPTNGSPEAKYRALSPLLESIATRPELTREEYAGKIHSRFPHYKTQKLVKMISGLCSESSKESGSDQFLPLKYAQMLQDQAPVIYYNGGVYKYRGGSYRPWYREEVSRAATSLLGTEAQRRQVEDVRTFLEWETFTRSERVNDPSVLNLANGFLNLDTGELLPHSPDILSTVQSQVAFDPAATCPRWEQFLDEILPEKDKQEFLAQFFGYCLTSDVTHHIAAIFYGGGANGKSVVTDILEALVGEEHCSALMIADLKGQLSRFRVAELQDKLVNISHEVEAKDLLGDGTFKKIVSGEPLPAERKNQPVFLFRPFCKMVICCNNLPGSRDKSYGYLRRIVILQFEVTIPLDQRNRTLAAEIKGELSGVLNFAIGGYRNLKKQGTFTIPKSSLKALTDYSEEINPALIFIRQRLTKVDSDDGGTPLKDIYTPYCDWCEGNGHKPTSSGKLRKAVEKRLGVVAKDRNIGVYLPGVVVKP